MPFVPSMRVCENGIGHPCGQRRSTFSKVDRLDHLPHFETEADLEANLMSERIRDYLIVIGHLWIGDECRDAFFENPSSVLIGFKLTQDEKERLHNLTEASFSSMELLVEATGLHYDDLREAIDHPRARMRHLTTRKR